MLLAALIVLGPDPHPAQLAYLAPRIRAGIPYGTQPPELTLKRLTERSLPLDWAAQERIFGFDHAAP